MKASRLHPREDQIAELTRGQRLPLPPIAHLHLDVIAETVARVWSQLLEERNLVVTEGDEAEINAIIESRLNNLWSIDPLWSQLVSSVARGKESLSFDGTHLEKRPDISVYLTGKHPTFPIVVECKIIDRTAGKGIDLYCNTGISRFIVGEYAWASSDAIMIAYIRDSSSVAGHLSPFLELGTRRSPDPWRTEQLPARAVGLRSEILSTRHGRSFKYPSAVGSAHPGSIVLWHLWLNGLKGVSDQS